VSLRKDIAILVNNFLSSKNFYTRFYATKTLGSLAPHINQNSLINIATDNKEDIDLRIEALEGIYQCGKDADTSGIEKLLFDPEGDIRVSAAKTIGATGKDQSVDILLKALADDGDGYSYDEEFDWDPQWDVQLELIKALGNLGMAKSAEPIIRFYEQEGGVDIGETVFTALQSIGGSAVVDFFSRMLSNGIPAERRMTCEMIGETGFHEMKDSLSSVLLDADPLVRAAAAKALALVGGEDGKVSLALLLRDSNDMVVCSVLEAMEENGLLSGIEESIKPLLDHDSLTVKTVALKVLGGLPNVDVSDKVTGYLGPDASDELILVASEVMAKSSSKEFKPLLLDLIKNQDKEPLLRLGLIELYEKFYKNHVAKDLTELLQTGPRQVSIAIAAAIAKCGDNESLDSLCELLWMKDSDLPINQIDNRLDKSNSTNELGKDVEMIGGKKAVLNPGATPGGLQPEDLILILTGCMSENVVKNMVLLAQSDNPELASKAIAALGEIGINPGEDKVRAIIAQSDPKIRAQAVYVAGKLSIVLDLVAERLMVDYDENVREKSANAIAFAGKIEGITALSEGLNDPSLQVRKACIKGLGLINNDDGCLNILINALFDREHFADLTDDICNSLSKFDPESVKRALVSVLTDPSKEDLHWIALDALGKVFGTSVDKIINT